MSRSTPASWPRCQVYGITMASDFRFANRLVRTEMAPELTFNRVAEFSQVVEFRGSFPLYAGPPRAAGGPPVISVYVHAGGTPEQVVIVRFAGTADHYLYNDRIVCHAAESTPDYLVEIQLLGYVLSIWLESQGILALHASAVVVNGSAVAFLASQRGGKSTLAASFAQAGFPLLTDDILAVEPASDTVLARPGYPQMRLWPEQAEHFLCAWRELPIVHPAFSKRRVPIGPNGLGTFWQQPARLGGIYVPDMRHDDASISIEPLSRRAGFLELLRNAFAAEIVEDLGWQRSRLGALARLVAEVPVRRLRCPRALYRLHEVREAILRDRAALAETA